jgi:Tol biopolymer transport system component
LTRKKLILATFAVLALTPAPAKATGTIVYNTDVHGDTEIGFMADTGGPQTLLNPDSSALDQHPRISPDGTKIAFESTRGGWYGVWAMGLDGSGITAVVDTSATDGLPSWSPNGSQLIFQSDLGGTFDIYTAPADGSSTGSPVVATSFDETDPDWSALGRITYERDEGSGKQIFIADADGTNESPLTAVTGPATQSAFSPDGTQVAFTAPEPDGSDLELWTIGADGSGLQQQTANDFDDQNPEWSPDGTRLVYVSNESGEFDIFTRAVGASDPPVRLTDTPENEGLPDWTTAAPPPVVRIDNPEAFENSGSMRFTFTLDALTTHDVTFTVDTSDGTAVADDDYSSVSQPVTIAAGQMTATVDVPLSPDGTFELGETFGLTLSGVTGAVAPETFAIGRIRNDDAFPAGADGLLAYECEAINREICIRDLASGFTANITQTPAQAESVPSISPDGTRIAFIRDGDLVTMELDGDFPLKPAGNGGSDRDPTWTPDGNTLIFTRFVDGTLFGQVLFSVPASGSAPPDLLQNDPPIQGVGNPDVSPDGTTIVADASGGDFQEIYTVPVGGGVSTQLTSEAGGTQNPAWSPSGTKIVYTHSPDLWTMNADGSSQAVFHTESGMYSESPVWSPDGALVAFTARPEGSALERILIATPGAPDGQELVAGGSGEHVRAPDWRAGPESIPLAVIDNVTVAEGGVAGFTVSLDKPAADSITIGWTTQGITATPGSDFTAASGTVTFVDGQQSRPVAVSTLQDTADEPAETFDVVLSAPSGAGIADNRGSATITDDDEPPPAATAEPTAAPAAAPTATPTAEPVPEPQQNKTLVGEPESGKVLVKLPGKSGFVNLADVTSLPNGTVIDTTAGKVSLSAERGSATDKADFFDGLFVIRQAGGITTLTLQGAIGPCPTAKAARAAAKKKKRRLWGDGKGRFRTAGKFSAATVRGTKWLVEDSCAGTLTRVARGVVTVRDAVRRRTVTVRKGKRYLARPRSTRNR